MLPWIFYHTPDLTLGAKQVLINLLVTTMSATDESIIDSARMEWILVRARSITNIDMEMTHPERKTLADEFTTFVTTENLTTYLRGDDLPHTIFLLGGNELRRVESDSNELYRLGHTTWAHISLPPPPPRADFRSAAMCFQTAQVFSRCFQTVFSVFADGILLYTSCAFQTVFFQGE